MKHHAVPELPLFLGTLCSYSAACHLQATAALPLCNGANRSAPVLDYKELWGKRKLSYTQQSQHGSKKGDVKVQGKSKVKWSIIQHRLQVHNSAGS